MDKIIINDVELLLDASDADVLETLEKEISSCIEKCNKIKDEPCAEIEKIKKMCLAVRSSIDNIFGEGTSSKIINRPNSLDKCVAAWQTFMMQLELINKAKQADAKKAEKTTAKAAAKAV